ncbi:MAG: type II toxin-antitoxin system VapC family toxin [Balneolaceae bacterium]|nr:type II toxin-antitoxin system VapC family toxin [Balneolaceae bacterium]
MKAVLDASVIAKVLFYEEGTEIVQELIHSIKYLYQPMIFPIEMISIITKKYRKREIDYKSALLKVEELKEREYELIPHELISGEAFEIATQLPVSYCDALYVSTAALTESILYSADERLVRGLSTTKLSSYVKSIYD